MQKLARVAIVVALGLGISAVLEARADQAGLSCSGPAGISITRTSGRPNLLHVKWSNTATGRTRHVYAQITNGQVQIQPEINGQQTSIYCFVN